MKTFLHVGCGPSDKTSLRGFSAPDWAEIRFDIDEAVQPDILGTITDMDKVGDGSVDAVFSSHNVEHLYPHEVPLALKEFARVAKPDGFAVVTCPDLQSVAAHVAQGNLTEPLYISPAGPIAPLDILFGHNRSIAAGNQFMAHRTGFTQSSLQAQMLGAGFGAVLCTRRPQHFDLWCVAWKRNIPEDEARRRAAGFVPGPVGADLLMHNAYLLNQQARYGEALEDAEGALQLVPNNLQALCSRIFALLSLTRYEECLARCEEALALYPGQLELFQNKAAALAGLWRNEEAQACYETILAHYPDNARSLYNSATILGRLGRRDEVAPLLRRAIELDPSEPWALGALLTEKLRLFDWANLDGLLADIRAGIAEGRRVVEPFRLLPVCDDPKTFLDATRIYVGTRAVPLAGFPSELPRRAGREKIRIGYFSSDFRDHPVLDLIAEVLARHDRSAFEVHAFSFFSENSPDQARARAAVDHFHDVDGFDPRTLVEHARAQELDIAIDLNGHTLGAQPIALATRVAPVQISWLGYPGTMGAPYIDYILADESVIPPSHRPFYTENVLVLPHCFQPNDSTRVIASEGMTRAAHGLPEEGFVYCCFNTPMKVTPLMLDTWAAILKAVDGSVLWMFDGNLEETRVNLRREAAARGVDSSRIIFAGHLERQRHLARHALADLFLDTSPFNAGATAACAIWAGLPILTFPGATFASRYGASILKAAGLEELIAPGLDEYREKAIALGRNPGEVRALKEKLAANRATAPLFDIPRFVAGLEEAYRRVVARSDEGLAPEHMTVADKKTAVRPKVRKNDGR